MKSELMVVSLELITARMRAHARGVVDGVVACGAREPGFDPNFIQMW